MRPLPLIVRRSLRQHALSSCVTALSLALACGLVTAIVVLRSQSQQAFTGGSTAFDAVLGARGSPLQLVLNTVFHLETSPGNIPWSLVQSISSDARVAAAVPYALGDNYRGFRIVGTSERLFSEFEARKGEPWRLREGGGCFDPLRREAVIGDFVARRTGLSLGSRFNPAHGLVYSEGARHAEEYTVVGVLEPTGTPADRVLWIPIEGIYRMGGHVLRGSGEVYVPSATEDIPEEVMEVSAVMLKLKSPQAGFSLEQEINKQGKDATLAYPVGAAMAELFDKLGWMNLVLGAVAGLVVLVATGSILASLYNTMNERRRELAILRALGARRATVFAAVVLEAASISAAGCVLGLLVHATILSAAAALVRARTGVVLEPLEPHPVLLIAPVCIVALGALAGLLPAWKAYRTDVAGNLS